MSPVAILGKKNPLVAEEIKRLSQKWNARTRKSSSPSPLEGTFDAAQCAEMMVLVKNDKVKDKSPEHARKRKREFAVFCLFSEVANALRK